MLGSKLKELRLKKNMSQRQLADLSGIDRTTIGKYELKNVRPSYEILARICRVLGTTPEYLISSDSGCTRTEEKPTDLITFIKKPIIPYMALRPHQRIKNIFQKLLKHCIMMMLSKIKKVRILN